MNIYVTPRIIGGKEAAVWLCIDRIEGNTVVLLDDGEQVYHLNAAAYETLVGRDPREGDVISAETADSTILAAAYDGEETQRRKDSARERLHRLFGKK